MKINRLQKGALNTMNEKVPTLITKNEHHFVFGWLGTMPIPTTAKYTDIGVPQPVRELLWFANRLNHTHGTIRHIRAKQQQPETK